MTVSTTTNKIQYSADGTVGPYAFNYRVDNATDLIVTETDTTSGVDTLKILTTDYTISGLGNPSGGNVTFVSGHQPSSGKRLTLLRIIPVTQGIDLTTSGDLPAETLEFGYDKLTQIAQQITEAEERSVKLPATTSLTTATLPDPSVTTNFGKFFRVKSDGTGIEVVTINPGQEASVLTTKGDLVGHTGSAAGRIPVGANETFLEADSAESFGVKWTLFATKLAAKIVAALFTILTTKGDLLVGTGATVQRKAAGANNNLLVPDSAQADGLKYVSLQSLTDTVGPLTHDPRVYLLPPPLL